MTEDYKRKVIALANYFYAQGIPKCECIRKAEAELRLKSLIEGLNF